MKKIVLSLGLSFSLITGAFAHTDTLKLLNSQLNTILAPFQNELTVAQLQFNALDIDDERVNQFALTSLYKKIGSKNTLKIQIDNLDYTYGTGESPTTVFKGSVGFDFTKIFSKDTLNAMVPNAIDMLQASINSYTYLYQDALSMNAVVTSTTKDEADNYTAFSALISAKLDLSKLPEEVSPDSILLTDAVFSVTLNLKTGVAVEAFFISNPEYIGFEADQTGLKETLEHFLNRDQELTELLETLLSGLDSLSTELVESEATSFLKTLSLHLPFKK